MFSSRIESSLLSVEVNKKNNISRIFTHIYFPTWKKFWVKMVHKISCESRAKILSKNVSKSWEKRV